MKETLFPTVDQFIVDFPLSPDDGEIDSLWKTNSMIVHDQVSIFGFFVLLVVGALRLDFK